MLSRKELFAINGAVLIAVLLSVSNIIFVGRQFDSDLTTDSEKFVVYDAKPIPIPNFRILILLSLIISGIILLVRAKEMLLVSMLVLMGAVAVYLLWLKDSIQVVRNAEATFSNSSHLAYLLHANWLDISVLCGIIILIIWEIRILWRPKYK